MVPQASNLETLVLARASPTGCYKSKSSLLKGNGSGSTILAICQKRRSRDKALAAAQEEETDSPSKVEPQKSPTVAPWRAGSP